MEESYMLAAVIFFYIFIVYVGYRGPWKYQRYTQFPLKSSRYKAEVTELLDGKPLTAVTYFDLSMQAFIDYPDMLIKPKKTKKYNHLSFSFPWMFTRERPALSYKIAEDIKQSRRIEGYGRIIKMLGGMYAPVSPGRLSAFLWLLLNCMDYVYFLLFVAMPVIMAEQQIRSGSGIWSIEDLQSYSWFVSSFLIYMIIRFVIEVIQYRTQNKYSKMIVENGGLFTTDKTLREIFQYLNQQVYRYIVYYGLLILFTMIVMFG